MRRGQPAEMYHPAPSIQNPVRRAEIKPPDTRTVLGGRTTSSRSRIAPTMMIPAVRNTTEKKTPNSNIFPAFEKNARNERPGKEPYHPGPGRSLYGKYPKTGARIRNSVIPPTTTLR